VRLPLFAVALLPLCAWADVNDLSAVRLAPSPKIDGVVDEQEWSQADSGSGFFDRFTASPAEGGRFWLGYDDRFVYFAARLQMEHPEAIRADEFRDNVSLKNDDSVTLVLETFGQLANFNSFGINSRGATSIYIAGGRAAKREWLGEFQAQGRKTATGYEVEARIPWSVMRLPAPGVRDLRFNVSRNNPTTGRETLWRYTRTNAEATGRWRGVDVPASNANRGIKMLPYVYGGADNDGGIANAGLDVKTSLTDRIDVVGSVSPDFRNIENQILSLDFSYFERLAGESRPFFLEGGQFFSTSMDSPLFASQRIRNFDAGFKTFGSLDDRTDLAVLDTIDFGNRNNFVTKIAHRPTPTSSMSFAATSLSQGFGPNNEAWMASYSQQWGALGAFGQWSESRDSSAGHGRRINAGTYYGAGEWSAYAEYLRITPDYEPRLGFAPQRDLDGFAVNTGWTHPVASGPLMEYGFEAGGSTFQRITGGRYSQSAFLASSTTWRNGLDFDSSISAQEFQGNKDFLFSSSLELPRGNVYRRWEIGGKTGHLAGQSYQSLGANFAYRPLPTWQISASIQDVRHFDRRTQTILSTSYDLSKSDSVSGRAVRRGNDTNFYLAYRRAGNKGAEYFVILGDPNARTFRTSLVVKAVFPFEIGG